MGQFLNPFVDAVAEPVSLALIHSLWQGSLIAIALAGALFLLRNRSPNARYAVACTALSVMFLTVAGTVVIVGTPGPIGSPGNPMPDRPASMTTTAKPAAAAVNQESFPAGNGPPSRRGSLPPAVFLFPFWLTGVAAMSLYHLWGRLQADRLTRLATREVPAEWRRRLLHLSRQLHLQRPIRMVESAIVRVPTVVGWIRPVVLMPVSAFTGLSVTQLELILAHELAHIRRHDVLVNYLQILVETCLFYHPAAWWVSRRIRIEREHCCDDLVVGSGDPLPYARALARMEGMRSAAPAMGLAVDGAPLLARIRRLTGASPGPERAAAPGKAVHLALWVLLTLGLGYLGGFAPAPVTAETVNPAGSAYSQSAEDFHGRWSAEQHGDVVVIEARFPAARSNTTFRVDAEQLQALLPEGGEGFEITRDAGTFFFEGKPVKRGSGFTGSGPCHFRIDPAYGDELERLGFGTVSRKQTFELAIHDVTLRFARGLVEAGYGGLSLGRLLEFHIHDVSPGFINELAALGYAGLPPDRLVEMRIHDVMPAFIRELAALGYAGLPPDRLVEMRIHDVMPAFIRELAVLGYAGLPPDRLVEMRIHDVTPAFIRRLEERGGGRPSPERLIEIRIHGDPEAVDER